ncbi:MAG: hypothetical protein N2999_00155 [Proteobacteria bacterium]|nr:hypothetical protein [Pseudomonadota bacterium]
MNKVKKYIVRLILTGVIFYIMYDIYTGHWGLRSYLNSRGERIRLTKEYNNLLAEKMKYEKDLEEIKTNPLFMEEQIKINLKKGNKGEVYYLFSEKNQNKSK